MKINFIHCGYSTKAKENYIRCVDLYGQFSEEEADYIAILGGDGFLLETVYKLIKKRKQLPPIIGVNCGTLGFLLNEVEPENIINLIFKANTVKLRPIVADVKTVDGEENSYFGYNEVALNRSSKQTANIGLTITDNKELIVKTNVRGDGIIFSTQAGSTAYNRSAGGPTVPLFSNVIPLTPICPLPPRWGGTLISNSYTVNFDIEDHEKRPVDCIIDGREVKNIISASCRQSDEFSVNLLYSAEECLSRKILKEQFNV